MTWVSKLQTRNLEEIDALSDLQRDLVQSLIQAVYSHTVNRTTALAAAFDLLVCAEYYASVVNSSWIYCPNSDIPLLLYPYTNTCPHCVLQGIFRYHRAKKPESAVIGTATAKLLPHFIKNLLDRRKKDISVYKGTEPIDILFFDDTSDPPIVFAAEIKAAPLLTLPLAVKSEKMFSIEDEEIVAKPHGSSDLNYLHGVDIFLYLPYFDTKLKRWYGGLHFLGQREDEADKQWAYRGLVKLIEGESFFEQYCRFWDTAFNVYQTGVLQTARHSFDYENAIYWYTNGCGSPIPRPSDWQQRSSGTSHATISDGKSSVGMDRTDDIKKSVYQVLKIGGEGRDTVQSTALTLKVGIMSNIHAVKHFAGYLEPVADIVWTKDVSGQVKHAGDLPADKVMYNLFDGIVTLTSVLSRDPWIAETFAWEHD